MRYTKIGKKEQEIVWKSLLNQNATKYNKIKSDRQNRAYCNNIRQKQQYLTEQTKKNRF